MNSAIRPIVWLATVVAAVVVGWYVKQAPSASPTPPKSSSGSYLFLAGGSDPYWDLCIAGAEAAAADAGAKLEVLKPTGEGAEGLEEQLKWLTGVDAEKFDGLAIGPIDPSRQTTLINAAAEKFPVVTVDSDAPASRRMFYIGSSNIEAGMIAAQMVQDALPDGGKIAVLMASEAKTNAVERKQGLEDVLARRPESTDDQDAQEGPTYEIVGYYLDRGDFDKCHSNVVEACNEHSELDAIVCTFGYHGPIALDALGEVEGGDKIKIIAFDEEERTLDGVEDGRIHATIVQDPFLFGVEAVMMLEKVRQGKFLSLPVSNGAVGIHCKAITQETLDQFREQLESRMNSSQAPAGESG